jgi:hypothetical protein
MHGERQRTERSDRENQSCRIYHGVASGSSSIVTTDGGTAAMQSHIQILDTLRVWKIVMMIAA